MKHNLLEENMKNMIINLRKKGRDEKKGFLVAISNALDTARRRRAKVNVFKLDIYAKRHKDAIFIVPGTVLGYGIVKNAFTVYAYKYSKSAIDKIKSVKGNVKTFDDLLKDNILGKDIIIMK